MPDMKQPRPGATNAGPTGSPRHATLGGAAAELPRVESVPGQLDLPGTGNGKVAAARAAVASGAIPTTADRPRLWRASDLDTSRRVDWLASRRIVAGAPNYMLGREGIGKSLFLTWLVARVTTGEAFPGFGIPARPAGRVVLVLTEDDWATIARPRLELAGADLDYVHVVCTDRDGSGSPTFPDDLPLVERAAPHAAAVIVDAWADTLPASLLVKDPQQARQALHPWKELASRTGVTVLLSGHTNRDTSSNVRNVYGMTGELRKKARMTILAQTDPDDDGVLVVGPEKANVAAPVPASRFRIESVQVFPRTEDSDGTVPRLVWIGDAEQSAREMFITAADTSEQGGSQPIDRWLRAFVTDVGGGCKAADVYEAGEGEGYTEDQLKRAKRRCRIVAERPVNPGPWYWMLPAKPDAIDG